MTAQNSPWRRIATKQWLAIVLYSILVLALPLVSEPDVLPFPSLAVLLAASLAFGLLVGAKWAAIVPLPPFAALAVAPFVVELVPALGRDLLTGLAFYQDGLSIVAIYFACGMSCGAVALGAAIHRYPFRGSGS